MSRLRSDLPSHARSARDKPRESGRRNDAMKSAAPARAKLSKGERQTNAGIPRAPCREACEQHYSQLRDTSTPVVRQYAISFETIGTTVDSALVTNRRRKTGKIVEELPLKRLHKMLVCGTEVTDFSIADPSDPGQLDIVGFDANMPGQIRNFSLM